jgi:hypothetical protein
MLVRGIRSRPALSPNREGESDTYFSLANFAMRSAVRTL